MAIFNSYVSSQRRPQATGNDTPIFLFFLRACGVGGGCQRPCELAHVVYASWTSRIPGLSIYTILHTENHI